MNRQNPLLNNNAIDQGVYYPLGNATGVGVLKVHFLYGGLSTRGLA